MNTGPWGSSKVPLKVLVAALWISFPGSSHLSGTTPSQTRRGRGTRYLVPSPDEQNSLKPANEETEPEAPTGGRSGERYPLEPANEEVEPEAPTDDSASKGLVGAVEILTCPDNFYGIFFSTDTPVEFEHLTKLQQTAPYTQVLNLQTHRNRCCWRCGICILNKHNPKHCAPLPFDEHDVYDSP